MERKGYDGAVMELITVPWLVSAMVKLTTCGTQSAVLTRDSRPYTGLLGNRKDCSHIPNSFDWSRRVQSISR